MYSFKKTQRLNRQEDITKIFSKGSLIVKTPLSLMWLEDINETDSRMQVLITVPKNKIKLASKRNLLKRRIREAIRLNKQTICSILEEKNKKINIAIIYQNKKIITYNDIEEKIKLLLARLINEL